MITDFYSDIERGKPAETAFAVCFLNFLRIPFTDVSNVRSYQKDDIDFVTPIGTFEVKGNYKGAGVLIFEDYTNNNLELGVESLGWVYKTKADQVVFVDEPNKYFVIILWTSDFKEHYESIKNRYKLNSNRITTHGNRQWQSAFRRIPLTAIDGWYYTHDFVKLNYPREQPYVN